MSKEREIPVLLVQYEKDKMTPTALTRGTIHPVILETIFKMGGLCNIDSKKHPIPVNISNTRSNKQFYISDIWVRMDANPYIWLS